MQGCTSEKKMSDRRGPRRVAGYRGKKVALSRRLRMLRMASAVAALVAIGPRVAAQSTASSEYVVKAAFLFHFAQFVEWPPEAFPSPASPLTYCTIGEDPFQGALDAEYRRAGLSRDFKMPAVEADGARFVTLFRSISLDSGKAGSIAMISDLSALHAKIRQYTGISAVVIALSVLATFLASSRLLRLITEPILRLAGIARKVSENDLRDCLESTLKTVALRADEKVLELLCEVGAEVPEVVRGDSTRLRQVITNLVGNAIKFTDQGEVALKVQMEGRQGEDSILHFTVSDTGIGIPKEKQESIFAPFMQADTSTTRKYVGTGLGLTISTRLVEMMGGNIWVESEVGRGSEFHFTMRVGTAGVKEIKLGSVASPEVLRGVKVLVVDDNRTNRRILEGMLKRWEMRSTSVEDGQDALAQLTAARAAGEPFGLILTDMHMPKMDGFTLIERIRQKPELATATIMMLTSAGHRGDAARCLELGVAAYLLKPIRQSELREAIARVLGARTEEGAIPLITRFSLQDAREPSSLLKVLLAEDNLVNQRLAVRLLEKRGYRVVVASNGCEALQALEKESFDLVFMDVQMPEMDGLEATAAIREKEARTGLHQPNHRVDRARDEG